VDVERDVNVSCVSESSIFDIEQHICEMANIPNVFRFRMEMWFSSYV